MGRWVRDKDFDTRVTGMTVCPAFERAGTYCALLRLPTRRAGQVFMSAAAGSGGSGTRGSSVVLRDDPVVHSLLRREVPVIHVPDHGAEPPGCSRRMGALEWRRFLAAPTSPAVLESLSRRSSRAR